MLKKILLVGGTGYLGKHLSAYLENMGSEVFISGTHFSSQPNYFKVDLEVPMSFNSLKSSKFDLVILLAAKLSSLSSKDLTHPDLQLSTTGYPSFIQYLKEHELTNKVIYISSMTVYASSNQLPVDENAKIGPISTYGLSKYIGECLIMFLGRNSNINSVVLRLPGIYGGSKKSGFIYNTISSMRNLLPLKISTKNLVYWETLHIDDLCEMLISFIKKYSWSTKTDIFNISYGMETDFYKTFEFIKQKIGYNEDIVFEKKKGYEPFFLSNSKLKELINVKEDYFGKLNEYISSI